MTRTAMIEAYLAGDVATACLYGEALEGSDDVVTIRALARIHLEAGHFDRAFALFGRAIDLNPSIPSKMDLAYAHLYARDDHGWGLHEARIPRALARAGFKPKHPRWTGGAAERLLIMPEGGYGDLIQFARFVKLANERCKSVVFKIPPGLEFLFQQLGVELDASKGHFPAHDAWCFAMSLPHALGLGFDDIGGAPYLRASRLPISCGSWPAVGLAWGGSPLHPRDNQRSLPPEHLEALLGTGGIEWHTLQIGPHATDLERCTNRPTVQHEPRDFFATAQIIGGLDLVLTVDTAIAHLAGALGKPTWLMLPSVPEWRWQRARTDCQWYDSVKIFRQEKPGDWAPVIAQVQHELSGPRLLTPSTPADGNAHLTAQAE